MSIRRSSDRLELLYPYHRSPIKCLAFSESLRIVMWIAIMVFYSLRVWVAAWRRWKEESSRGAPCDEIGARGWP
jgi:hypothetical protein